MTVNMALGGQGVKDPVTSAKAAESKWLLHFAVDEATKFVDKLTPGAKHALNAGKCVVRCSACQATKYTLLHNCYLS